MSDINNEAVMEMVMENLQEEFGREPTKAEVQEQLEILDGLRD